MCIDIVEIRFGIATGQISSNFDGEQPETPKFSFPNDNLSKCQVILRKTVHALILRRSGLGLLIGKFHQFLTELSTYDTITAGYYCFTFLFKKKKKRCNCSKGDHSD